MNIFDFLFPKYCVACRKMGSYLCANCFSYLSFDVKSLCLVCNKPSFNGLTHPACRKKYTIDGCFSALSYNKTTQKLIYSLKYKPYLADLKSVLADLFYESIIQNESLMRLIANSSWLIVSVPLSNTKFRKRGYNQAEILAKELSQKFNFPFQNILKRIRDTKTQVGLSNKDRKKNIAGAFDLNLSLVINHSSLENANIFLVDDVVTTGSTLLECASVLKRRGAKRVIGLTLARD